MVPKDRYFALETRADGTKLRIFEKTLELVEVEGVESLTVRRIADASNVSPALIIQYFGSKDKLLQRIFETRNDDLIEAIRHNLDNHPEADIHDKLMTLAELILDRDQASPRLTLQTMSAAFRWDKAEEEEFRERLEPFLSLVSQCIHKTEPSLSEDKARVATMTFFMCYTQAARVFLQHEMTKEQALKFLEPHIQLIADGIRCQTS